jgi:Ca2+-binding EF-hand superfamily protein
VEPTNIIPANATEQEVSDFFKAADSDADGYVTKDEIKTAFSSNS